ncbi:MAG: ribosome small subunit-dependent GTPase A [Bacteroidales bacterium]|nr:ribosome small subunit-dependent GTPase A [Bacteroidales bacterium]
MAKGIVIKSTGSSYWVRTPAGDLECKIKGNLRIKGIRSTSPVVVGDNVTVVGEDGNWLIGGIDDRRNYIVRKPANLSKQLHIIAANIDLALLVVTVNHPETNLVFIDRFLATTEAYRIPACLVFNKTDLYNEEETAYLDGLFHLYSTIGYPCHRISVLKDEGIGPLVASIQGKVCLLSGNSGVGKSSLLNRLYPQAKAKVGRISGYHDKGRHTTSYSEMYDLGGGTYIIDTPGIKGFNTFDMQPEEVSHYFPEIFKASSHCRYHNCTHTHEPDCAVQKAIADHLISESRYRSYLSILQDADEGKYRSAQ